MGHGKVALTKNDLLDAKNKDFQLFKKLVLLLDEITEEEHQPVEEYRDWPHMEQGNLDGLRCDVLDIAEAQYRRADARAQALKKLVTEQSKVIVAEGA